MSYFHGVRTSELSTDTIATVQTMAGLPVVIGRAPVHLTDNPMQYVNKPVICYSFEEAVSALGYSDDWNNYELCEVMFSQFKLYGVKPIVFINVLDPSTHKTAVTGKMYEVNEDEVVVNDNALLNSFVVKADSYTTTTAATVNTDYTVAYNSEGKVEVSILSDGSLEGRDSIYISYDKIDPSKVTALEVVGGVSNSGEVKGMELIDTVYTQFGEVPGIIAAPNWSENPVVASVMTAKAQSVSGIFKAIALTDVDTTQVRNYMNVNAWKRSNNYSNANQIVCYPCVKNEGLIFHMSTHLLGVIGVMDAANDDIPYMTPSNRAMQITGLCLKDGTEVLMSLDQANLLNEQGVVTGLNFSGGFKVWGNYTAAYPSTADPKDAFICCRRMFDWQQKTFILNYWQTVDAPLIPRIVRSIVDSESIRLNGLVARGFLIAASIEFIEDENPTTDLLAGKLRVHVRMTPPVPAQEIDEIVEYDASAYSTLFEAAA